MKQYLVPASVGLAALGLVVLLLGSVVLGGVMLGTAAVGWYVDRQQGRVTDDQLFEIEKYANRREDQL